MAEPNPILSARKSMKLTQSEMAAALGVNLSTVWRWEKEHLPISERTKKAVEQLLSEMEQVA